MSRELISARNQLTPSMVTYEDGKPITQSSEIGVVGNTLRQMLAHLVCSHGPTIHPCVAKYVQVVQTYGLMHGRLSCKDGTTMKASAMVFVNDKEHSIWFGKDVKDRSVICATEYKAYNRNYVINLPLYVPLTKTPLKYEQGYVGSYDAMQSAWDTEGLTRKKRSSRKQTFDKQEAESISEQTLMSSRYDMHQSRHKNKAHFAMIDACESHRNRFGPH